MRGRGGQLRGGMKKGWKGQVSEGELAKLLHCRTFTMSTTAIFAHSRLHDMVSDFLTLTGTTGDVTARSLCALRHRNIGVGACPRSEQGATMLSGVAGAGGHGVR